MFRKASYCDKIKNLKHVEPRNWWNAVKTISGMNTITRPNLLFNIDDLSNLSDLQVANKINGKFLEPLQAFQPLQVMDLNNNIISNPLTVTELEVCNCLNSINPRKSGGSDDFPSCVLKECATILSLPVINP